MLFYSYTVFLENQYEVKLQKYDNQQVQIQAVVVSQVEEKEYQQTVTLKVEKIQIISNHTDQSTKQDTFLVIGNMKKPEKTKKLAYGDRITFSGQFEAPDEARNEGGFNYQIYLKTKKIQGTIQTEAQKVTILQKNQCSFLETMIFKLKTYLIEKIQQMLPSETAGLCIGLLLGETSYLTQEIQDDFKNASLSHLLAISGDHISYILLCFTTVLSYFRLHKRWSKIITILFLIFFMALVGFSASVTRACIMSILNLIAGILFLKADIYQNLAISMFLILLVNPYSIFDIGLQLSFGGTLGIVLFSKKLFSKKVNSSHTKQIHLNNILEKLKQMMSLSLAANLAILPILLYHFNTFSATFLISNLLASPILIFSLISSMIFILLLLVLKPLGILLSYFLHPILSLLIQIARITGNLPFSQILVPTPSIWQIGVYYFILFMFFFCKDKLPKLYHHRKKILLIAIFVILLPHILSIFPSNQLTISMIDVGQGDSILVQTPMGKTLLVDGGGSEMGTFDVGEKTLLPYLLDRKITKIDYLLFSHFDSDHCKGLLTILEKIKVKNVIIARQGELSENFKQFSKLAEEKQVKIILVQAGDKISLDSQTKLNILFPEATLLSENILNNNSIVAKLIWSKQPQYSLLLTGDIEQIAEEKLINAYQNTDELQATILKVAHHGSKSSSTFNFLELIKPKISIIGVGENNHFGHPNEGVLDRLKNCGSKIYRTDLNGEIVIVIRENGKITVKTKM